MTCPSCDWIHTNPYAAIACVDTNKGRTTHERTIQPTQPTATDAAEPVSDPERGRRVLRRVPTDRRSLARPRRASRDPALRGSLRRARRRSRPVAEGTGGEEAR